VTTLLVEDIGVLVHGDSTIARCAHHAPHRGWCHLRHRNQPPAPISYFRRAADRLPGLVDGHVHPPSVKDARTNSIGWIHNYLHAAPRRWCPPVNCTSPAWPSTH